MRRRTVLSFSSEDEPLITDPVLENNSWKTISRVSRLPEFADMTDSEIQAVYGWKVGDCKSVVLSAGTVDLCSFSGGTYQAMIMGFNHNKELEGSGIQFAVVLNSGDFVIKQVRMNTTYTNVGGWKDSKMRTVFLPQFENLMPSDLRNKIRATVKYTNNKGSGGTVIARDITATEDRLFLMSEYEYYGNIQRSSEFEIQKQKRYQYMTEHGSLGSDNRWLRSAVLNSATEFSTVGWYQEQHGYIEATRTDHYIIPCFRI